MGLRTALAQRYGAFEAPLLLSFRERVDFLPTEASPSLVTRTKTSSNVLRSIQRVSLSDLTGALAVEPTDSERIDVLIVKPEVEERADALTCVVTVSENLLEPFDGPNPTGKNYTQPDAARLLFEDRRSSRAPRGDRKAYKERTTPTGPWRKSASLWDLILPLLKPPLNLDFPTQIDLPSELYPFQVVGVQHLAGNESFLLADEMGTGKTVMSCVALRILFHRGLLRRALVVCPANIVSLWDRHLEDWGGTAIQCTVVRGTRESRARDWHYPAHVYVTSYETLRNDIRDGAPLSDDSERRSFDLVLVDEAHRLKNPGSRQSRAVLSMDARFRWALTGTPLQNKIDDLAGIFRFVKPGLFPKETPSPAHAKELMAPFFLRRRKMDVLRDLPEKVQQNIWLEMDSPQREAYEVAMAEARAGWMSVQGSAAKRRAHVFALVQRLKQICNFAPGESTSAKLEFLLDQLDEIFEENKACIFTQYIGEGLEKIVPHLERYGVAKFHGSMTPAQKQRAIDAFQEDDSIRVFVGQTKAAGEGITLTAANYAFHFDQWWNPARAWQAEDRLHREGQLKQVNVYSYWMSNTYEERIFELLEQKGLLHEEVVNAMSEKEINASVSMDDWCKALGLEVTPAVVAEEVHRKEAQGSNLGETYQKLQEVAPSRFEEIVAEVFRHMGYPNAHVTGQAYDGGIDIRASRDAMGGTERIAVQCKRQQQVGVGIARELLGALEANPRISQGFLVVSGKLTPPCRQFINERGNLSSIEGIELAKRAMEFRIDFT